MIFLEADEKTFQAMQGYFNSNGRFEFRELPDGRWVIHESIVNSPDFPELIPDLQKLPKTTYTDEAE